MKIILILLALVVTLNSEQPAKNTEYVFKSTYPEGFGVAFKKEETIKKITPDPRQKNQRIRFFVVDAKGNPTIEVSGFSKFVQEDLEKAFTDREVVKIKFIGYESIDSSGVPGLSESVKHDDVILPASTGWRVDNILILIEIL